MSGLHAMPPFPESSRESFQLWFRTEARGWGAWSGEHSTPAIAAAHRSECLKRFPGATAVVVRIEHVMEATDA